MALRKSLILAVSTVSILASAAAFAHDEPVEPGVATQAGLEHKAAHAGHTPRTAAPEHAHKAHKGAHKAHKGHKKHKAETETPVEEAK